MTAVWILIVVTVVVMGLGGYVWWEKHRTQTSALTVKITLTDKDSIFQSQKTGGCVAKSSSGYEDITFGTQIVVKDNAGKIIATGALTTAGEPTAEGCTYTGTVPAVPELDIVQVEVSHRGSQVVTKAERVLLHGVVSLTLG